MSKVYIIGATGGIGAPVVKELLEKNVQVTALVRDPSKAEQLFGQSSNLTLVKGDYEDLDGYKSTIAGHDRLFLLVSSLGRLAEIKINLATIAYAAGVKQVVHVSSVSVCGPWRESFISTVHYDSEVGILSIPNRGKYVTLRPNQFFSNHFFSDDKTIRAKNEIYGSADPDQGLHWVSSNDIAKVAVTVMTEPIEKHDDCVYNLTTVKYSGNERAAIISKVLGKEVKYVQIPVEQRYKIFTDVVHMPHSVAIGLVSAEDFVSPVNKALPILLGRPVEGLDAWFEANKEKFL
ncbi:hypothetical protein INT44_008780 [Umbelopsis vinacea]|uniref:NmrA-like domain-containing protein n=1 Tax=Umbelopsis vinacea TaxID=44442 RepID=A0A8H7PGG8_9FUNG|nr:hypothetical protein INT44_008780 [Umbelopsis vinacea]